MWVAIRSMLSSASHARAVKRILPWTVAGIVLSVIGLLLWKIPEWQLAPWKALIDQTKKIEPKDFIKLESDLRTGWAQILGGAAVLIGVYLTWRTYRLSREGQITDRFSKAIDHLDYARALDVRLGGIYALERIARDSERDHWPIMEVLTAYVRERAPRKDDDSRGSQDSSSENANPALSGKDETKIVTDIQAILTVLGRREKYYGRGEERRLNLERTDLRGADLVSAHMEGARLMGAYLGAAYLGAANLQGADLQRAYLAGADLKAANLQGASLWGADLKAAYLAGANLAGANLAGADLKAAYLAGADLRGADLAGADLKAANLQRADLQGAGAMGAYLGAADLAQANLGGANLGEAVLYGAALYGADLKAAYLEGADLRGANLAGADLKAANLQGASLWEANLQRAYLEGADLKAANLQGASLWEANLQGADLYGADLQKAVLKGADLSTTVGLTISQLVATKTLYNAKLPPDLLKKVQEQYPHLLEEPKSEPQTEEKPK